MIFKMLPTITGEPQVYARIDDDGLCRLTCTAAYPELQSYLQSGGELQDADGNVMSADDAKAFILELP